MSNAAARDNAHSSPALLTAQRPRLVFLDVIRGLAALCVFLEHTTEESTSFTLTNRPFLFWSFRWFNLGRMGVAAFFLVSGFVIPYSLERANSLKTFWVSRVFRLYPIFWFSLLVIVGFHLCGNDVIMGDYSPQSWDWKKVLLINATMLQQFVPPALARYMAIGGDHVPNAIALYWTLTLELTFYVVVSALFVLGLNKRSVLFAWLGLLAMLGAGLAEPVIHHKLPVSDIGLLTFALLGTVVFRYYSGLVRRHQLLLLAIAAVPVYAIAFGLSFRSPLVSEWGTQEWTSCSMFTSYAGGALLFGAVFLFRDGEFALPLRWLGTISYSFYLLHYLCWMTMMGIPHHGIVSGPLWQLAVFAVACGVSSATYLLIEKPAVELGKHLLGRPKPATELGRPVLAMSPIGRANIVTNG
jgi:peptidoglycan/LPS O-acetylase OafA/YrhL